MPAAQQSTSCDMFVAVQTHLKAILKRKRQHAHCTAHAVTATDPVPEAKGILRVNAKLLDKLQVCGHRHHVLGHGLVTCTATSSFMPHSEWEGASQRVCWKEGHAYGTHIPSHAACAIAHRLMCLSPHRAAT